MRLYAVLCRFMLMVAMLAMLFGLAVMLLLQPMIGAVVLLLFAIANARRPRDDGNTKTSHGSARAATAADAAAAGMASKTGLILGRMVPQRQSGISGMLGLFDLKLRSSVAVGLCLASFWSRRFAGDGVLRIDRFVHVATFAPTGRGKGVGVIIPNLLSYRGNCVVIDPKGENFLATAAHRAEKFGHRVVRLDPFNLCGASRPDLPPSARFNPLDFINASADDFIDQCRDLANMLVVRTGLETENHWLDSAELVLTSFIAFVCACEKDATFRNLTTVRAIVSSRESFARSLEVMKKTEGFHGLIQRLGDQLGWFVDRELGSVLSTVQRMTAWLDSPVVAANISASTFDPRTLRGGRCTVYLIVPHDRMHTLAPLQRMWLGSFLHLTTLGTPTEANPLLYLVDEAAHIGKIRSLEEAITLKRGAGIRTWLIFQSISQLQSCYGDKANTILENIDTRQFFGVNSIDTAEHISKTIGEQTIGVTSRNVTTSYSRPEYGLLHHVTSRDQPPQPGNRSTSTSFTHSDIARRLLKPEELMTLPDDVTLIFHRNSPVVIARLIRYFDAPEFRRGRSCTASGLGVTALLASACLLAMGLLLGLGGMLALADGGLLPPDLASLFSTS